MEIFLFLVGYFVQFAASCILLYKIWKHKSIYGLSIDTQACYMLAAVARCVWSMETRLVETKFAYLELILSTAVAVGLSFMCFQFQHTAPKQSTPFLRVYATAPAALVLAFFFHPGDDWFTMQILVSYTMFQEGMGLLPQLWLMRKMHEVEPLTSHYAMALSWLHDLSECASGVRCIFWVSIFCSFSLQMFSTPCCQLITCICGAGTEIAIAPSA
ncbi:ER lumen protein-retaining receptor 1 (KDEL endoplasmic reticulum protein retention receptor 1) (KDEL receptor 1) [Durusdinium trenchii]|uniref:ER lumen protein-retaining receptor 1 (KDEL endoplasmic reticulum protein retention receptor 1) (KDEL receptor 1) n=1 Tax=Durusdinium trenchii TaxID=1381693 RepID=A0ABP0J6I0_9DINO